MNEAKQYKWKKKSNSSFIQETVEGFKTWDQKIWHTDFEETAKTRNSLWNPFAPFFPNSSHDRFLLPFSRVGHKVFIPDVHTLSKVKTVSSLWMYGDNKAPLNFLAYDHSLPSNWYYDHLGLGILCGSSFSSSSLSSQWSPSGFHLRVTH